MQLYPHLDALLKHRDLESQLLTLEIVQTMLPSLEEDADVLLPPFFLHSLLFLLQTG